MKTYLEEINDKFKNIAIFGQGYVGLPLSLSFAFRGCNVYGVDVVGALVKDINNGITHHTEEFEGTGIKDILKEQIQQKRYRATTSTEDALKVCRNIIVTVGIPIKNGKHDLSDLESCARSIGRNIKTGDLIIIRSTVIPGTTQERVMPILERESGLKAGEDFYLAYSSERIAEGNAFNEFAFMPTVVAGIDQKSAELAKELLSIVCKTDVITASSIKIVETAKVFENVQRDVNIAMAQEFARFAEGLGIDIFEVIKVANTHKRVNLLTPGPGVGGYCIPNAYYYIEPKAADLGISMDILSLSRKKNEKLPAAMIGILEKGLKEAGKDLKGSKIGILGLAMKDYSNDDRISPPVEIVKLLLDNGVKVNAYDPAVPTKYDFKVDNLDKVFDNVDGIMILAKQKEFDDIDIKYITQKLKKGSVIVDTKNLFTIYKENMAKAGIILKTI